MIQLKTGHRMNAALAAAFGASAILLLAGPGCLSTQTQTSLDGTQSAPYVEVFVEYPGPQERWSGPTSFLLHVSAKDEGSAQIVTTPGWADESAGNEAPSQTPGQAPAPQSVPMSARVPASALGKAVGKRQMSAQEARELLGNLNIALQGAAAPFKGCMSPVRVRLVRADGALTERQGCRSEIGWARAISETVNIFVGASVHGYPPEALAVDTTEPAAAPEVAKTAARAPASDPAGAERAPVAHH